MGHWDYFPEKAAKERNRYIFYVLFSEDSYTSQNIKPEDLPEKEFMPRVPVSVMQTNSSLLAKPKRSCISMMKKSKMLNAILAFVLSAAVAVSVTSCGSNSSTSSSSASSETSVSESVSESSEEESSEEASSEESSEAESSEASSEESAAAETSEAVEATDIGEGATEFTFEVVLEDGTTSYYTVHTDETTVGAALLGVDLIAGEDSEYGLYVKTVDGVTADYNTDGTYWAFYIDGEYASTGVDSTDVTPGSTYSFKVEK